MALSARTVLGALACVGALMWMGAEPAAALPLRAAAPASAVSFVADGAVAPLEIGYRHRHWRHRHWRHRHWRHRHWRHRRHYRPGFSIWFGTGPRVGVPYRSYGYAPGRRYYYDPAPPPRGYRWKPVPGSPEWYAYCASKYKSFNPRTGRYLAYSGKYRRCR